MSVAAKLVGFLVALVAVAAAAVGVGRAVGPVEVAEAAGHGDGAAHGSTSEEDAGGTASMEAAAAAALPKGLMVSQGGYTLRLDRPQVAPGRSVPVSFTIEGPDGRPVTAYDVEHEKELHLIAVRRDFSGFQHVHPEMAPDGTWRTGLDLDPGQWRLFADFKPTDGDALTLGNDLAVGGSYRPAPVPSDTRTAQVDGYTVELEGDLSAGAEAELSLRVSRDGRPVTDLQPYLGAYGHLVALRGGDLAYLHVHPDGAPGDGETEPGPEVVFFTEVPSPGRYHLYLDFKHEGVVRTAAFVVTADADGATQPSGAEHSEDAEEPDGGHSDDDAH
jgi:hypothetical protein